MSAKPSKMFHPKLNSQFCIGCSFVRFLNQKNKREEYARYSFNWLMSYFLSCKYNS